MVPAACRQPQRGGRERNTQSEGEGRREGYRQSSDGEGDTLWVELVQVGVSPENDCCMFVVEWEI